MEILVLGGTRFVGRALIDEALTRGWQVTALHRGLSGATPPEVEVLRADRTSEGALAAATTGRQWDVVVDTWSGPPYVAASAACELTGHAGRYAYVSSGSVYAWGRHSDETSPLVAGDPTATEDDDYATAKRGAEIGVVAAHPDALLVRAGLILGPHEDIGRLPWWLTRIAAGAQVVAPGRPDRLLQYVDARDLAAFVLTAAQRGERGPVDTISRSGHTTTSGLLTACVEVTGADAELVWVDDDALAEAGVEPWTRLPCWVPERGEFAGFLEVDTARALAAGLTCRPVAETVADTWEWMQRGPAPAQRPDRPVHGLPTGLETRLLSSRP